MKTQPYIEVAFPLPLQRNFTYQAPSVSDLILVGQRVLAPFGKKSMTGYIVGISDQKPNFPTKAVSSFLDSEPLLQSDQMELARWLSDRYLCSLGEALACILPVNLKAPKRTSSPAVVGGGSMMDAVLHLWTPAYDPPG